MGTHPIFESDFDCLTERDHVMDPSKCSEWEELKLCREKFKNLNLRNQFKNDEKRFEKFNLNLKTPSGEILFDYSKNLINCEIMEKLFSLAKATNVEKMRNKMFNGEKIN